MEGPSEKPNLERAFASCFPETLAVDGGLAGQAHSNGAARCSGSPLLTAVYQKDVDEVRRLIALTQNGNVDFSLESEGFVVFPGEKPINNATALWTAATTGQLEIVTMLLNAGAAVNHASGRNSTPLRSACFDGHVDVVKCLLERGADVNVANDSKETPLTTACARGHSDVAEFLLKSAVDVDVRTVYGDTALHIAAECGRVHVVELLVKAGAQHLPCAQGWSPLTRAAAVAQVTVVAHLVEYAKVRYSAKEIADALELLGATTFLLQMDKEHSLSFWGEALKIRVHCPKENLPPPRKRYGMATEAMNAEDILKCRLDDDYMFANSILIVERILCKKHFYSSLYARCYGDYCLMAHRYEDAQLFWLDALEIDQVSLSERLDSTSPHTVVDNVLINIQSFSQIDGDTDHRADIAPFFKCVISTLQMLSERKKKPAACPLLVLALQMLGWWARRSPELKFPIESFATLPQDHQELLKCARKLVQLNVCLPDELSVLHACVGELSRIMLHGSGDGIHTLPSAKVTQLMLAVGASTKVYDCRGNTPLHFAVAEVKRCMSSNEDVAVAVENVELLLKTGAHQDMYNCYGVSAQQMLFSVVSFLPKAVMELIIDVLPLRCLAARAAAVARLPYDRPGLLPHSLVQATEMHCNHP